MVKKLIDVDRMKWHKVIEHPGLYGRDIIKRKDSIGFSLHYGKIVSGGMIDDPGHPNVEVYFIFKGKGRAKIGSKSFTFSKNCVITVQPNVSHKIENIGKDTLHLIAILRPAYI